MDKIKINDLIAKAHVPRLGIGESLHLDLDPNLVNILDIYSQYSFIKDVTIFPNHQFRRVNSKPVMKGLLVETEAVLMPSLLGPRFGNGVLVAELPPDLTLTPQNLTDIKEKALQELNFATDKLPPTVVHMQYLVDEFYSRAKAYIKDSHILISNKYLLEKAFREPICKGNQFIEIRHYPISNKLFLIIHGGANVFSSTVFTYYQTRAEALAKHAEAGFISITTELGKKYIADLQIGIILAQALRKQQASFMRSVLCKVFKRDINMVKVFDRSYTGISTNSIKTSTEKHRLLHYNGAYRFDSATTNFIFITDPVSDCLLVNTDHENWKNVGFIPAYSGNKHELPKSPKFLSTLIDMNKKKIVHNMVDAKGQEHCAAENFQDPYLWLSEFPKVHYARLFPMLNLRSTQC